MDQSNNANPYASYYDEGAPQPGARQNQRNRAYVQPSPAQGAHLVVRPYQPIPATHPNHHGNPDLIKLGHSGSNPPTNP